MLVVGISDRFPAKTLGNDGCIVNVNRLSVLATRLSRPPRVDRKDDRFSNYSFSILKEYS